MGDSIAGRRRLIGVLHLIVVVVLISSVIVLLLLLLLLLLVVVLKLLIGLMLQLLMLVASTHDSDAIARASGAVTAASFRTRTALATTGLDGLLGS